MGLGTDDDIMLPRNDFSNIDNLATWLNNLENQQTDAAASAVADACRKYRDFLEQKVSEVEQMLLGLNMNYCTPMAVTGLKVMFDVSVHRKMEEGMDRVVEIFYEYLTTGKFVKEHVRLLPEFYLPLARELGFYCLQVKQNEELAYTLSSLALRLYLNENDSCVTSLHSVFFASAIKTNRCDEARPYIYTPITSIVSELPPSADHIDVLNKRARCNAPAFFDVKYILLYLYYGSMILLKVNDAHRALQLLEMCITVPGASASVIQMDALKKYYIVSLMVKESCKDPNGTSPAVMRAWKTKGRAEAYISLTTLAQINGNRLEAVKKVANDKRSVFEKDDNWGLLEHLIQSLREKAVLKVAKSFSSISLQNLARRAYCDEKEVVELLKLLVDRGELEAEVNLESGTAKLAISRQPVTIESIQKKEKLLAMMREEVSRMDIAAQLNPSHLVRTVKSSAMSFFQDDEGLSESASPMDA